MSNLILQTWHQCFLALSLEDKDYIHHATATVS